MRTSARPARSRPAKATAPLSLDFANCLSDRVGEHGLRSNDLVQATAVGGWLATLTEQLNSTRGMGWERWRNLPFDPMRTEHVSAINRLTRRLRNKTANLVVLGIGGSALGNIALQSALNPVTYHLMPPKERGGPRLFVAGPSIVKWTRLSASEHSVPSLSYASTRQ